LFLGAIRRADLLNVYRLALLKGMELLLNRQQGAVVCRVDDLSSHHDEK